MLSDIYFVLGILKRTMNPCNDASIVVRIPAGVLTPADAISSYAMPVLRRDIRARRYAIADCDFRSLVRIALRFFTCQWLWSKVVKPVVVDKPQHRERDCFFRPMAA